MRVPHGRTRALVHLDAAAVVAIHAEVIAAQGDRVSFIDGSKRTALAACLVFLHAS